MRQASMRNNCFQCRMIPICNPWCHSGIHQTFICFVLLCTAYSSTSLSYGLLFLHTGPDGRLEYGSPLTGLSSPSRINSRSVNNELVRSVLGCIILPSEI